MFTKHEIRKNLRRTAQNGKAYAVGDVVRFVFDHSSFEPRVVIGRIVSISPRYTSRDSIGYMFIEGELLKYVDYEEDEDGNKTYKYLDRPQYADASFIADVLSHYEGPARSPLQRFKGPNEALEKTRSQYVGWPNSMLWDVLNGKHLDMPMPLDEGRFWQAFQKQKPGVVEELHLGLYRVNRKSFERWVMRNYRRFLASTADCIVDAISDYEHELALYRDDHDDHTERHLPDETDIALADALDASHRWFGGEGTPHMDELYGDVDERERMLFDEETAG